MPGRTANDVKNYWNCHLSKRLGPQDVDQTQDTKLQLAANPSPASPGAAVEIIRPHPRSISAASARPPSPNYGAFQEEQGSTSTVPPPPPSMLFVEDNGGESSSWVIHSSKGKDGGMGMGSCCYQGMEDHHQVGGILAGGGAVAGEEMIGMDFRFEQVQVSCGDESCSSKWDWDDLICDMDLWGESL
ncbi:unnamed protein product [Linum tenue]|uniref:HTH myb-type domain-containing protein n=1 Tax=Linum tenue TaxID=586396 RepID=A0AAV0LJY0_9ROSI|nr:unnamed protein product [Linum tenue]